jgi:hypothetical protein
MSILRFVNVTPVHLMLLQCASWIVPSRQRAEWSAEWRAELWYVSQRCNDQDSTEACNGEDAIAFCLGAFKDAFWLRRHTPLLKAGGGFRLDSARQCGLFLAGLAAASLMVALLLPGPRNAILRSPYHDRNGLLLICPDGYLQANSPTIPLERYEEWKHRTQSIFTDFAFYRPLRTSAHFADRKTPALSLALASDNLFELLDIPVSSPELTEARASHRPALLLSQTAWHRYFDGDPHISGKVVEIAGQRAMVAAIVSDDSWRLPQHVDAWLLEDESHLAALPSASLGYVLGHVTETASAHEVGGRLHMLVPDKDSYDGYDCVSLATRILQPFRVFLFALMLACLALPATTPLPLGNYPITSQSAFSTTRRRRWIFLLIKLALILPLTYCASLDLAYLNPTMSPVSSEEIQLLTSFCGLLFSFRWALRDQRHRCPVCLRLLTNPARVGQPSRNFLAWNGTELMCGRGHGLLHVPEISTSWFSTQRWLYLDPSWHGLFHEAYLPTSSTF